MPKIIIHAAEGTFAPAARAALVTELTDFALDCEGLPTSRFMTADLAAMRASPPDKPAPCDHVIWKERPMSNILIVLSAADRWTRADRSAYATGVWAEELVDIDEAFAQAGFAVDIATPGGVRATIDPHSVNSDVVGQDNADRFIAYLRSIEHRLAAPLALADVVTDRYDAIVIPGGHGPVEDLHQDADMGRVLAEAQGASTIIAPVCHGQAALLAATDGDGKWLFAGRRMTAFSDEEEVEFGTAGNAPWLLADTLRQRGARYEQGPTWQPFLVRDGNLLTGQNPASSKPLAEAVIAALA